MERRVSVTGLEDWLSCRQYYQYHYIDRPELDIVEPTRLTVGRAVARAIEVGLGLGRGVEGAFEYIRNEIDDPDVRESARSAVSMVPSYLWESEAPISEDRIEVQYCAYSALPVADCQCRMTHDSLYIVGRPDLWVVENGEIVVYEFKTCAEGRSGTERKLELYEDWGIQAVRYAVLVHDAYPWAQNVPISRRHVVVSTRGFAAVGGAIPVTVDVMRRVRDEMVSIASEIGRVDIVRNWSFACTACPYRGLCAVYLTGGRPLEGLDP